MAANRIPGGADPQAYSDLAQLSKLRKTAREDSPEALRQVAQQFEQMFLNNLLKSMRESNQTIGQDNFLNSSRVQFYQGMFDEQLSLDLARNKGIGLSEVLVKQLGRQLGVGQGDAPQAAKRTDIGQLETQSESNLAPELQKINTSNTAAERNRRSEAAIAQAAVAAKAYIENPDGKELPPHVTTTAANTESLPGRFDSQAEFVDKLLPLAERTARKLGVEPRILLAQAALETGWGKHLIHDQQGQPSYNLFNIKADNRWQGEQARVNTLEYRNGVAQQERAGFRMYEGYAESFADYADFLRANPRYREALQQVQDPFRFVTELQRAGYATDPEYAQKISRIFTSPELQNGLNKG